MKNFWIYFLVALVIILLLIHLVSLNGFSVSVFHGATSSGATTQPIPLPAPRPIHQEPAKRKLPVYHRVLKGGKVGGVIDCSQVPQIAYQYPKATVETMAHQYGLPEDVMAKLHACLK